MKYFNQFSPREKIERLSGLIGYQLGGLRARWGKIKNGLTCSCTLGFWIQWANFNSTIEICQKPCERRRRDLDPGQQIWSIRTKNEDCRGKFKHIHYKVPIEWGKSEGSKGFNRRWIKYPAPVEYRKCLMPTMSNLLYWRLVIWIKMEMNQSRSRSDFLAS